MNFKPQPIVIDGRTYTPKAIEKVDGGYMIADKFIREHKEYFRYDMSADIKAEEAAAEATVRALMLGNAPADTRLSVGFHYLED